MPTLRAPFKIGDKVIAKKNNGYGITRDGWMGTVTDIWYWGSDWKMKVLAVAVPGSYIVLCDKFFLLRNPKPVSPHYVGKFSKATGI